MSENQASETSEKKARRIRKVRTGVVVSAKRLKTITVEVTRRVKHGEYGKLQTRRNKFHVHDELGCQEGDRVRIEETRPLSKTKRWRVLAKLEKGAA